jgi:hypothetical protein
MGFKIVQIGGGGKKVYVHPLFHEHDIHQGSVVGGGMSLHVLLLPRDSISPFLCFEEGSVII